MIKFLTSMIPLLRWEVCFLSLITVPFAIAWRSWLDVGWGIIVAIVTCPAWDALTSEMETHVAPDSSSSSKP